MMTISRQCTAGCRIITGCFTRARQQQQQSLPGNSSRNSQKQRYKHSSALSSSNNYNPLRWYASKLDTHPIVTKIITSGIIAASGDLLCQYLTTTNVANRSLEGESSTIIDVVKYDWKRTIRFFILGSCLVAPTVHAWYNILMKYIPGTNVTSILKRLTADQGFFGPIFTGTFISCLTVLEHVIPNDHVDERSGNKMMMMMTGGGKETTATINDGNSSSLYMNIITRIQTDLPNAIIVGWAMWIPSMAFMFTFVPGKYQVLFSNGVGLVWNTYLSWRTNQDDDDGAR